MKLHSLFNLVAKKACKTSVASTNGWNAKPAMRWTARGAATAMAGPMIRDRHGCDRVAAPVIPQPRSCQPPPSTLYNAT